MGPQRKLLLSVVLFIVAIHGVLLLDNAWKNFATSDEPGHLAAGISHWETDTYSMYRVNPPLPRMLAVLPALLASPNLSGIQPIVDPSYRAEAPNGKQFADDNANRYLQLVWLSRFAGVLWSLAGAGLIYAWATELGAPRAGFLGVTLWCFSPSVLAHAPLITPDLPAAVAGLAATYAFWHYVRKPSWKWTIASGLCLGIAELTKFTLLCFYALWPLLWWLQRRQAQVRGIPQAPLRRVAFHALAIMGLSLLVINLGYGFDETCWPLGRVAFVSRTFAGEPVDGSGFGNRFADTALRYLQVPLPLEFVRGIDVQRRQFENNPRPSYLAGRLQPRGWWYYYLYALAVKVPLGVWLMVLWAIGLTVCSWRAGAAELVDEAFLWLPALAVITLVSAHIGFNRHLRYVLPAFPFVIISTSKLGRYFQAAYPVRRLLLVGLLSWSVGSTLYYHPHHLSYFNELVGGPDKGDRHLLSSNLDWGQDLLYLKTWYDAHPEARPFAIAYCNTVGAYLAGIKDYSLPPTGPANRSVADPRDQAQVGPMPGWYAISANFVHGLPYVMYDANGQAHYADTHDYDYFEYFTPVAKAGYSIFIYHVTPEEANRVRRTLGLTPLMESP